MLPLLFSCLKYLMEAIFSPLCRNTDLREEELEYSHPLPECGLSLDFLTVTITTVRHLNL